MPSFNATAGTRRVRGGRAAWPSWRTAIGADHWGIIATQLDAIDPEDFADINPNYPADAPWRHGGQERVTSAWSSGSWSERSLDYRLFGGGHGDYAGNEVYYLDLKKDSPAWGMLTLPTGAIGNEGTLDDGQESSGIYFDGRPRSSHTYGNLFVANDDNFYVAVLGSVYRGGQKNMTSHRFLRATNQWEQLATSPAFDSFGAGAFDASRNEILYFTRANAPVTRLAVDTLTWATISGSETNWNGELCAVIDPTLDVAVILHDFAAGKVLYHPLPISGSAAITATTSGTPPAGDTDFGIAMDDGRRIIYTWDGGADLITLTPPASLPGTWAWNVLSPAGGNPVTPPTSHPQGTWTRFWYSPYFDACFVVNRHDEPVYVRAFS